MNNTTYKNKSHSKGQFSRIKLLAISLLISLSMLALPTAPVWAHGAVQPSGNATGEDPKADTDDDKACNSTDACSEQQCAKTDKPVSLYSGKEFYSKTDLLVKGLYPIEMTRRYDSHSKYDSPMGYGWSFTYDKQLFKYADGNVVIRRDCGVRDQYTYTGGGYTTPIGARSTLLENTDGTFTVTYPGNFKEFYNADGTLNALQSSDGHRLEMTYDNRGSLPITGSSPFSLDPATPTITAYLPRLVKIEERHADNSLSGNSITLAYNETSGRLTSITSNDGRTVSYLQDTTVSAKNGNLTKVTGLESIISDYGYNDLNDAHNLTDIRVGEDTAFYVNTYDTSDRVTKQVHGNKVITINYVIPTVHTRVTQQIYDTDGITLLHTQVTNYEFNEHGFISKMTDAAGNETRYSYTSDMRVERKDTFEKTATSLKLLNSTSYQYDALGNQTRKYVLMNNGELITTTKTYDQRRIASVELRSDKRTQYSRTEIIYNHVNGDPTTIKEIRRRKDNGAYLTTQITYDTLNRPVTITLPDGHQIILEYTNSDFVTKIYHQNGATASNYLVKRYDYDTQGNVSKTWDAKNNLTTITYDNLGRVTSILNALNEEAIASYDRNGNLTQIEQGKTIGDGEGQVTKLNYDTRKRITSIERKNDAGIFVAFNTYTYDSNDNVKSIKDAVNRITSFNYDILDRRISVTDAETNTTQMAYDARDRLVEMTDALTRTTRYHYDPLGRLIKQQQLGTGSILETRLEYDHLGNLLKVIDPENRATTYTYDALSRRLTESKQLGQTITYAYDDRDRVDYMINARGNKLDYGYETWGALKEINHYTTPSDISPIRTITYGYDLEGNMTATADNSIQAGDLYGMTYDSMNRQDVVTVKYLPSGNITIDYNYDRFGNVSALNANDGSVLNHQYVFNKLNELKSANLPGSQTFSFDYYANSDLQTINYPNGLISQLVYKQAGPIESITTNGTAGQINQLAYTYDSVLNVDTLTDSNGLHDYDYDGIDRLINALHPVASGLSSPEAFAYDGVGNRLDPNSTDAYAYDNNNRMLKSLLGDYTYDADGNTKTISNGTTFTYDFNNRLKTFDKGTVSGQYLYDPMGRRIRKNVNGVITWFVWAGDNLLAEYDSAGNRTKRYVTLPGELAPIQYADANGIYNVHTDHLSMPRYLSNALQEVVWRSTQSAFGQAIINDNPDGDVNAVSFNVRFPGQYYDSESGLHYNFFRYYDPETGRYVTSDPIGLAGGLNTYAYAELNPLVYIDPTGEFGLAGMAIGAIFDIGVQLSMNGGRVSCINWSDVAVSAVVGAVAPGIFTSANKIHKYNKIYKRSNNKKVIDKASLRIGEELIMQSGVQATKQAAKAVVNHLEDSDECKNEKKNKCK